MLNNGAGANFELSTALSRKPEDYT